jgi:gluconokinase
MSAAQALIVMGVSGAGKTTVGQALAERLDWPFFEGDDFHPPANLAKMADGLPLSGADRAPWLARLNQLLQDQLAAGASLVLACSALKAEYRAQLSAGVDAPVRFIFLKGDYELIHERMQRRSGHYMRPELLRSQFEALEEPRDALTVQADQAHDILVNRIIEHFSLSE